MKTTRVAGLGVFCVALVVVSACAAGTRTSAADRSSSRDLITESELLGITAVNAFNAVQQLRPQWLRSRGASSLRTSEADLPVVYLDEMRFGDLTVLQNIPIAEIAEIRYISGPDATTRWGTGVSGGVIQVIRQRG